jgi:hypothetical protein
MIRIIPMALALLLISNVMPINAVPPPSSISTTETAIRSAYFVKADRRLTLTRKFVELGSPERPTGEVLSSRGGKATMRLQPPSQSMALMMWVVNVGHHPGSADLTGGIEKVALSPKGREFKQLRKFFSQQSR